jgi:protein-L-isoaspartate(D-aspartate) O-methyltransferase
MPSHLSFPEYRERMVAEQIEARGIHNPRLLAVMREIPRHRFVASQYWDMAYEDNPLPTRFHQTISQPYIVALMTSLLQLSGSEKVLEIGTGSGYQAAILARLAREVYTIEVYPGLADQATQILKELDLLNVTVYTRDGSSGLPEQAPFDRILVTAAAPQAPQPLLDQLAEGGCLVIPVGSRQGQELQLWEKQAQGFQIQQIAPVAFVPLRGNLGWSKADWKENEPL